MSLFRDQERGSTNRATSKKTKLSFPLGISTPCIISREMERNNYCFFFLRCPFLLPACTFLIPVSCGPVQGRVEMEASGITHNPGFRERWLLPPVPLFVLWSPARTPFCEVLSQSLYHDPMHRRIFEGLDLGSSVSFGWACMKYVVAID